MPEWVRVKDPATGHEITVTAEQAALAGVQPLKKEAVTPHGEPRQVTYSRTVDEAAAAARKGA